MSDLSSEDEDGPQVSLTGFLFGNVDTKTGKLEDQSIFGLDSDKQIKALENLGLGFQTVLTEDEGDGDDESAAESNTQGKGDHFISKSYIDKTSKERYWYRVLTSKIAWQVLEQSTVERSQSSAGLDFQTTPQMMTRMKEVRRTPRKNWKGIVLTCMNPQGSLSTRA